MPQPRPSSTAALPAWGLELSPSSHYLSFIASARQMSLWNRLAGSLAPPPAARFPDDPNRPCGSSTGLVLFGQISAHWLPYPSANHIQSASIPSQVALAKSHEITFNVSFFQAQKCRQTRIWTAISRAYRESEKILHGCFNSFKVKTPCRATNRYSQEFRRLAPRNSPLCLLKGNHPTPEKISRWEGVFCRKTVKWFNRQKMPDFLAHFCLGKYFPKPLTIKVLNRFQCKLKKGWKWGDGSGLSPIRECRKFLQFFMESRAEKWMGIFIFN